MRKAAVESNKVAREIVDAQVRAYLTCTGGEYNIDDKWVFARPFLANKGQSPAKSIRIRAYLTVNQFSVGKDGKITTDVKARTEIFEGSCQAISSQSQETGILVYSHVDIGKEAFAILRAGTMAFHISGQVIWNDVLDRKSVV